MLLQEFGYEYFDTDLGYGGYSYDGRYADPAASMIERYGLNSSSLVLDVGCAKGYLVYEFQSRLGPLGFGKAFGCDISDYALCSCLPGVERQVSRMSAEALGFRDHVFDLVVSVDTLHNLPPSLADKAILEIMRVTRRASFIQVASCRSPEEREALRTWGVTLKTFRSEDEWLEAFDRLGFTGDYWLKTFPPAMGRGDG